MLSRTVILVEIATAFMMMTLILGCTHAVSVSVTFTPLKNDEASMLRDFASFPLLRLF